MGTRVLIAIALVALVACERTSSKYCEKNPQDYQHCPAPDGALVQCTGNADCPKNLPACNVSLGLCVGCLMDTDCKDPDRPHCDVVRNSCVECTMPSDCPSGVCEFGGVCLTLDNTAYVDAQNGTDNPACSMAMPCKTVGAGIAVGKPIVQLHGNFIEKGGLKIADGVNVTLTGDDGTTYQRLDNGVVITIGMNGVVAINNLDISSATKMGLGIQTKAGTFTFSKLTIHDCPAGPGGGILIGGGSVAIAQSNIYDNLFGISLMGATHFDITNNMIVHNGSATAAETAAGAILGMGTGTDRFEFNTVSDNTVKMAAGAAGGISCPATFTAPNNILSNNFVMATSNLTTQATATCLTSGSLVQADDSGLGFTNTTTPPYDYHITSPSNAIDRATADPNVPIDYDGQNRPRGGGWDFGADEF